MAGTRIAQSCGDVLNEIVENISSVNQMASEISTACNEQALGVREITKAMSQLDQVTQTNASASEMVATSAEQLSGQSVSLHSAVKVLVRVIDGDDGSSSDEEIAASKKQRIFDKKNNVMPLKLKARPAIAKTPIADVKSVPSEDDPRFKEA